MSEDGRLQKIYDTIIATRVYWSLLCRTPIIVDNFISIIVISEDVILGVSDDTNKIAFGPTASDRILSSIIY